MKQVVLNYSPADNPLREAFARSIAQNYGAIRSMRDETATKIKEWLECDSELCFMVMDILTGFSNG